MRLALILTILLALAALLVYWLLPPPRNNEALPGRPLLGDGEFHDAQIGLRLTPPPGWSMQVRSTEAPEHRAERLLVKYKRYGPEAPAWVRVRVIDAVENQALGEFLRRRKAPEAGFTPSGAPDESFEIAGRPAARQRYRGQFDSDGRGLKPHLGDVSCVRQGASIVEFAATIPDDETTRMQLESFLKSIHFD